jgi:hypothetical protein
MDNTVYVICGGVDEFMTYQHKKVNEDKANLKTTFVMVFSSGDIVIKDKASVHGVFCGSWRERIDIRPIVQKLIMASTKNNPILNRIWMDLSK